MEVPSHYTFVSLQRGPAGKKTGPVALGVVGEGKEVVGLHCPLDWLLELGNRVRAWRRVKGVDAPILIGVVNHLW